MADFATTVTLATSGGTPVLTLDSADESTYVVRSVAMVEESAARATVTSPDMHGAAEVSSVLEEGVLGLVVCCYGASWSAVWAARNALVAAARAASWQITVEIEGVALTYQARAVTRVVNPIEAVNLDRLYLDVTLSIPVHPVPEEA